MKVEQGGRGSGCFCSGLLRSNSLRRVVWLFYHPINDLRLSAADDFGVRPRPSLPSLPSLVPSSSSVSSMTSFGGNNATATIALQDLIVSPGGGFGCLPSSHTTLQQFARLAKMSQERARGRVAVAPTTCMPAMPRHHIVIAVAQLSL